MKVEARQCAPVGAALREDARPEPLLGGARAAVELGLGRGEFARAVQLGLVRPGPRAAGGAARFARAELERVKARRGHPDALRAQVETVAGADHGARVLGTGPTRFTRLARCGHLSPVGYRVNRYRALVWLYLAAELRAFAAWEPGLLSGAAPPRTGNWWPPERTFARAGGGSGMWDCC